ncbi:MAG: hypothetical protein ACRC5A_00140, partial [Enterobacteriaceae bacterium]
MIKSNLIHALSLSAVFFSSVCVAENLASAPHNLTSNAVSVTPGDGALQIFLQPKPGGCFINAGQPGSVRYSNLTGGLDMSTETTQETLKALLNFMANGSIDISDLSTGGSAEFLGQASSDRYKISATYVQSFNADATYIPPQSGFGEDMLTPQAKAAYEKNEFAPLCGDAFIQQAQSGAALIFSLSVLFETAQAKINYQAKYGLKFASIFNFESTFKMDAETTKYASALRISAMQIGGYPNKLADIFGEKESGHYPFVSCSKDNVDACLGILDNAISYAKNDFQTQIDLKKPETLYYWSPVYRLYSDFGIHQNTYTPGTATYEAISYLEKTRKQYSEYLDFLTHYMSGVNNFIGQRTPYALGPQVTELKTQVQSILTLFDQAPYACFTMNSDKTCSALAARVKQAISDFSDSGYTKQLQALFTVIYIADDKTTTGGYSMLLVPIDTANTVPDGDLPKSGQDFMNGKIAVAGNYFALVRDRNVWAGDVAIP